MRREGKRFDVRRGPSRRDVLVAAAAGTLGLGALKLNSASLAAKDADGLKPGEYRWSPEKSPEGPVAVIVSIPDQRVYVYRNGVLIGLSTCSTGRAGHSTPTGVFTVLQKDRNHHSSTYDNAPMPNMNRLTWSGIALHAGALPGYPASHGCVRLPLKFSELLFGVTHIGTPVIIADDHSQPADVTHPGMMLSAVAEDEMSAAVARLAEKKLPPQERHPEMQHAVSVLVSRADRELYVIRDGDIVAQGAVSIARPDEPFGSHVFLLTGAPSDGKSLRWQAVSYATAGSAALAPADVALINRIESEPALAKQVAELMHPGLVMVFTDLPAHPETRSVRDFVVVTQDHS